MKIIVLRHATRVRDNSVSGEYLEKHLPLDTSGEREAKKLGIELARRGIKPAVFFTSCFAHAKQTGDILRDTLGGNPPAMVVELCTLTPHYQGPREWRGEAWQGVRIPKAIIREAELTVNDLRDLDVVAFILHQPRLKQLLASMTSREESEFGFHYSEGVCLTADSLDAFLQGNGQENEDGRF